MISHNQLRPGLPADNLLADYRIWDSYFTPAHAHPGADGCSALMADIQKSEAAFRLGRFEKLCWFAHVGLGTTSDAALEDLLRRSPSVILRPLERWPDLLLGMIQLNAAHPAAIDAVNRWLADGPMYGVYFPGGGPVPYAAPTPPSIRSFAVFMIAAV